VLVVTTLPHPKERSDRVYTGFLSAAQTAGYYHRMIGWLVIVPRDRSNGPTLNHLPGETERSLASVAYAEPFNALSASARLLEPNH
jgi:hypothetical protein